MHHLLDNMTGEGLLVHEQEFEMIVTLSDE